MSEQRTERDGRSWVQVGDKLWPWEWNGRSPALDRVRESLHCHFFRLRLYNGCYSSGTRYLLYCSNCQLWLVLLWVNLPACCLKQDGQDLWHYTSVIAWIQFLIRFKSWNFAVMWCDECIIREVEISVGTGMFVDILYTGKFSKYIYVNISEYLSWIRP